MRSAFSLVELVTVMVIMGVLAAIAAPRLGSSISYRRAEAAAYSFKAGLEDARTHAMTHATSQEFFYLFDLDPGYALTGLDHPDHDGMPYFVRFPRDLWGLEIVDVDLGHGEDFNRLMIEFDMYGKPDSGGFLSFSVGPHVRTITIDDDSGLVSISR